MPCIQGFASFSQWSVAGAVFQGWGLYAEYLGHEMGLYENPYQLWVTFSTELHELHVHVDYINVHVLKY